MESDSLHEFRDWKNVVKNLAASYDFKLLYAYIFMIKWTGFEFQNFKVLQLDNLVPLGTVLLNVIVQLLIW